MAQIITTLTITHAEVLDILKVHFNLRDDTQVTITDQDDSGWFEMSPDWGHAYPPAPAEAMNQIEVTFDDGRSAQGHPYDWTLSWDQSSTVTICRIVKYRNLAASHR